MHKKIRKSMQQMPGQLSGLQPGVRMKGGVMYDPSLKGFVVIVHSWDNVLCVGKPVEWRAAQEFPTEETALQYYKTNIRPELEKMASQMGKSGANIAHRKLEE